MGRLTLPGAVGGRHYDELAGLLLSLGLRVRLGRIELRYLEFWRHDPGLLDLGRLHLGCLRLRFVSLRRRLMVRGDRGYVDGQRRRLRLGRAFGDQWRGGCSINGARVRASLFGRLFAHCSNTPVKIDLLVTFIACEILTFGPAYRNFRNSSGAELSRDRGTSMAAEQKM